MECLVAQEKMIGTCSCGCQGQVGATGIVIDIGQEVKSFIQANPLPAIGIGAAMIYLIYSLLKK